MKHADRRAQLSELAAAGFTVVEAAQYAGVTTANIHKQSRVHGWNFARGHRGRVAGVREPHPLKERDPALVARAHRMSEMYRNGCTLAAIGSEFKLTRERVRQIITKEFGLRRPDGGMRKRSQIRLAAAERSADLRFLAKYGCTRAEWREIRKIGDGMVREGGSYYRTPLRAYASQRNNAKLRGIPFTLTLHEWWDIWMQSGKWSQRGRGQGYVMSRIGDEGGYTPGNVFIATAIENSSRQKRKKSDLPVGVRIVRGKFYVRRMIFRVIHERGPFSSQDQASAAYLALSSLLLEGAAA